MSQNMQDMVSSATKPAVQIQTSLAEGLETPGDSPVIVSPDAIGDCVQAAPISLYPLSPRPMNEPTSEQFGNKPLLTLAIPTYNRSRYLRELLSVLHDQVIGESRVELIISDNASPDDTPSVVAEFQQLGLPVRYLRNPENIGADSNFLQCFKQARGKYFWLFGDDDIIVPGGISQILSLLTMDDYALVYINPYVFRKDYVTEKKSDRFGRFAEILPNGLKLTQKVGAMLTFISAVIVNKESFAGAARYPLSNLVGTNLIQLGWVCPLLASDLRVLVVWEKLVAGRGGNCAGWGVCQVFGVNLKMVVAATTESRSKITATFCNRTLESWFPDTIMEIRQGLTTQLLPENMRATLEPIYKNNWRYWTYVYPLIAAPLAVARTWHGAIRISNRLRRILSTIVVFIFSRHNLVDGSRL
jgi:glycosyltransferase involved in cell wall biosynthesis